MRYSIVLLFTSFCFLFNACIKDDSFTIPETKCTETNLIANKSVQTIHESATSIPTQYMVDDVIEAYVTSSDRDGNFYKTISFQSIDHKLGFSIPVDDTNLYLNYEPGRKVYISLQNRYTDLNYKAMRIGGLYLYPGSRTATVGRLSVFEYQKVITRSCTRIDESALVRDVTIDKISDSDLNMLIQINNVQFISQSVGNTLYESTKDTGGATNHIITDKSGNQLFVRVGSFALFKEEIVSEKSGKITGILTKYADDYQLMPRYYSDIKLDQTRF